MTAPSNDLRATRIFTEALELPIEERPRFLDQACAGNPDLRAKVEALLTVYPQAESLFRNLGVAADEAAGDVAHEGPASDRTAEAPRTAATATNRIGHYRILEKIGEGGFGEVFIAQQTEPVKRRVALKVLKAGMDTKSVLARFEAERQALAMMDHPNIAKVLDAGETEQGRPYFVMDLVEGEPITDYCDRHTLSTKERLELFMPVCRAVQHAHQKGIIHRDIKPSNILVTITDGKPTPKVIDFGIAKATSASLTDKTLHTMQGQLIGTPAYMSPEQAEMGALDVDTRTDIYSLGVVLYELLAGSLPFDPESLRKAGFAEIQRILRLEDPPKPSTKVSTLGEHSTEVAKRRHTDVRTLRRQLRGELDWITLRAMEKDRTRRYETPNSLAMDIGRYLADEPVIAGPPSTVYRARKFAKRNKVAIGVAALILIAVTAWAIQSEIQKKKIEAARDESEAVTEFLAEMLSSVDPAQQGKDVTVREIMDEAAETIGEKFADQPLVEAHLRHTMGKTYSALTEYEAAELQLERALEIRRQELGEEHLATLQSTYQLLDNLMVSPQRFNDAEARWLQLLETERRVLGDEHPETLKAMHWLGALYRGRGRNAEAESLLVQVIETRRRVLGEEHPSTLSAMYSLGLVYGNLGGHEEALELQVPALEAQRRVLGEEHPQTLQTQNALARTYRNLGRFDEAESLYVPTMEARRRVLGEEHPSTLASTFGLATVYGERGRSAMSESLLAISESLLAPVVEISRRTLGDEHDNTIIKMGYLGLLYRDLRRYAEAESLHLQTLDVRRRVLGPDDRATLWTMEQLADLYTSMGRDAEARTLAMELLGLRMQAAEGPQANAMAKSEYAWFLLTCEPSDLRDPQEALRFALAACEQTDFANPNWLDTLALAYHRTGQTAKAIETQKKALALLVQESPESPQRANYEGRLAEYEAAMGEVQ